MGKDCSRQSFCISSIPGGHGPSKVGRPSRTSLASAALVQSLRTSCPLATLILKGISFGHTSMYVVHARRVGGFSL